MGSIIVCYLKAIPFGNSVENDSFVKNNLSCNYVLRRMLSLAVFIFFSWQYLMKVYLTKFGIISHYFVTAFHLCSILTLYIENTNFIKSHCIVHHQIQSK
jgi:hypothetical protein